MPCEIVYSVTRLPEQDQVIRLYREAGWITDSMQTDFVLPMLKNSHTIATAYDGGKLVGMMRALSDGVSDAYLLDLVVDSTYRKAGIGKKILDTLTGHMAGLGIDWIVCIGAPGTEAFYKKTNAENMTDYVPYRFPVSK